MDIQHIRYFLAVAKHQSFSKAARELYVTQPIVTRCVKNLEKELGTPLILRSTKSFSLTEAGHALVRCGTELLQQHRDIYRSIQDVANAEVGEIHISCPGVLLDMYFPKLVTQYRRKHPGIRITVQESGTRTVVQDVLEGSADIGLVMLPLEGTEKFHVFPIVRDEVHIFVHQDHPFAKEAFIGIDQLKNLDIITYNQTTTLYNTFIKMCSQHGFSPVIAYQSMMPGFILDTLTYGDCIGVLPAPMLKRFPKNGLVSIPLQPHFPWEIAMITRKDRYLSLAAEQFLLFAQEFIAKLPNP